MLVERVLALKARTLQGMFRTVARFSDFRIYAGFYISQTIIFDVASPLDDVRAPPDAVKSTAIALVKVDSTFLPGSTIGATHWVAYAMTKGTHFSRDDFKSRLSHEQVASG